ncbi:MAG TPA: exosortase/archaeosortase family protein [Verrucomicrobiae bacterium]|nr:exosortase/archaeosortase family protein [Verrucomicrobiae bacterium]
MALFSGIVALLFSRSIVEWVRLALSADTQSYMLLVPVISAYLIRIKRHELRLELTTSAIAGSIFIIAGIAAAFYARTHSVWPAPVDRLSVHILALLLLLFGGCFFFVGFRVMRQLTFPLSYLIFCVPVPTAFGNMIEIFLQYTSAEAAYWMLSLTNVPMIRSGLNFTLPGIPLRVAQECSGFNSTFSLFLVSLVAAHMFLKSPSRRATLALAVIPLAILRNGFRITTIALLCVYVSPDMIDSYIHHKGGPIFFGLSLIPFFMLLWFLRKSEIAKHRNAIKSP